MKILALDTSTKFLCIGIYDNAKIYEYKLEVGRQLSSLLAQTIERVVSAANLDFKQIDYFACGLGPGSFTGIRIGLATIKGFAWSLNKPIIGIPALDGLAKNALPVNGYIAPIIDAKRGLVYCSIYKARANTLKRITPYKLMTQEETYKAIKHGSIILGDALGLYKENIIKNISGLTLLDKDYWYPAPRNIISLALERIAEKKLNTAFDVKPIYLYPKECQIRKHAKK